MNKGVAGMDRLGEEQTSDPKSLLRLMGVIQHLSIGGTGERQDQRQGN